MEIAFVVIAFMLLIGVLIYKLKASSTGNGYDKHQSEENYWYPYDKDNTREHNKSNLHWQYLTPSFISMMGMVTKVAKSDGIISPKEATVIKDLITQFVDTIAEQSNITPSDLPKLREQLVQAHKNAKTDNAPISTYAIYLVNQELPERVNILKQLIHVAIIDGYNDKKESLVYEAGKALSFSNIQIKKYIDKIVIRPKQEKPTNPSDPYHILRCKRTDSTATIKQQYRSLIRKYHPDFIQSKELDEAFIEFAKQKLQEINNAYDIIKKERSI